MKKRITSIILLAALVTLSLAGCSSKAKTDDKTIKVGATPAPHEEILNEVKPILEKEGYTLEIVEYNDYVLPNTALANGELDANFFQHKPYLDDSNKENNTDLVSAAAIHFEPFGIYAGKTAALADLADGATVAIPNDATNEARALLLLEAQGLIKLKADAGINATILDIEENPLNLEIQEMEAAQIVRALADVDIACINGNYALGGGYTSADALAIESVDSLAATTYANIIAVKSGNENSEKIQALIKALQSEEVRTFIEGKYEGAVVPTF